MKRFLSKCASCAGGIGICLCTIFMSLSVIGATAVGLSKNANSGNSMGGMGSMTTTNSAASIVSPNTIVNFFSGFWGEVILLVSFGLMLTGMWFTGKKKVMPLSIAGVVILYISMYVYYSIALEVVGVVMLALAYTSAYSYKVAKMIKLV
jgi:hypothetical protein